jgi:hypothetical protein
MFGFFKKYGLDIAELAHKIANMVENEGPAVVGVLRTAAALIPGIGPAAAVAGTVIQDAEIIAAAAERPPSPVAPPPPPAPAPANPNPLRQPTTPAQAAAVAAVDAEIAKGSFEMAPPPEVGAPAEPAIGGWKNPARGP